VLASLGGLFILKMGGVLTLAQTTTCTFIGVANKEDAMSLMAYKV
jgi:hypothetical protein